VWGRLPNKTFVQLNLLVEYSTMIMVSNIECTGIKIMDNRRKQTDRRTAVSGRAGGDTCNRRNRPDRRLKSISSEWIPMEHIKLHPATRLVFSRR
jgi:hypothetical protein